MSIAARDIVLRSYMNTPVGSRVTSSVFRPDADYDYLYCGDVGQAHVVLMEAGFVQEGSPEFYTGNDNGGFRSYRATFPLGGVPVVVNIIVTPDPVFFDLFLTATALAKRFDLTEKADRIALFQAVLYGVHADDLFEPFPDPPDALCEPSPDLPELPS